MAQINAMHWPDEKLREWLMEVATRVVPEYQCAACQRVRHVGASDHSWILDLSTHTFIKPCASCSTRRPFGWARDIPLDKLRAFLVKHGDDAFMIGSLRELLPQEPRGSSRFEFL